jgi:glycosyltransferase involved in cell wall biosynthesis
MRGNRLLPPVRLAPWSSRDQPYRFLYPRPAGRHSWHPLAGAAAYNEEDNIEIVVRRAIEVLPEYTDGFEIVVVNDGSRDRTAEIIDRLAAEDSRVRPVHHTSNQGYGGAVNSGFKASTCDYVMFMDADRQFDIADIRLLTPFAPLFDIVAGFRWSDRTPSIGGSMPRCSTWRFGFFSMSIFATWTAPSRSSAVT